MSSLLKILLKIFNPSFFDIFGVFFYVFLVIVSIWSLKNQKPLPKIIIIILLLAGIVGFILDSFSVYKFSISGA